jgi:hypothetical protein
LAVATLRINTQEEIEFQNIRADLAAKAAPFVRAEVGEWEMGKHVEAGVVVDAAGTQLYAPILSANDARKLAKWLNRAADLLDGCAKSEKKNSKKRTHYEEDDDNPYQF